MGSNSDMRDVIIPPLEIEHCKMHVIGTTPLVCGPARDPNLSIAKGRCGCVCSRQWSPLKEISPGIFTYYTRQFQCSAVDACDGIRGVNKITMRQAFHAATEFERLYTPGMEMQDFPVQLAGGERTSRLRPVFKEWAFAFTFVYQSDIISPAPIKALLQRAGYGIGVGDFRPQCTGTNGQFRVAEPDEFGALIRSWGARSSITRSIKRAIG